MAELSTRDIYLKACKQIADRFEDFGFSYVPNGPKIKKSAGDLSFEISFSSSMYNLSGHKVAMNAHAWVKSRKMKKWRRTQPQCRNLEGKVTDVIAHSDIQYLPEKWILNEWNLADPDTRGAAIEEIIDVIKNDVLPFFEKFRDPELIASELTECEPAQLGMVNPRDFIEFALCFLSSEAARKITVAYLQKVARIERRCTGLDDFSEDYEQYAQLVLDENHRPNGHGEEVAFYSIKYGWGNLSKEIR